MAETCDKAFGRYLRTLRDRRGLTLDAVVSLSQTFPDIIHKGYLSRCENGFQKPAFSKIIALSRIYEVPADVLVERMELDMELDRVGGPDTSGLCYDELVNLGRLSLVEGFRWRAYGFLRAAVSVASLDVELQLERNSYQKAVQNLATVARALGRYRFALHEFLHLEQHWEPDADGYALLLERIACCYRLLNDSRMAVHYSSLAVSKAENVDGSRWLGHVYNTRSLVAFSMGDLGDATNYCKKAFSAYRDSNQEIECALTLSNLAHFYVRLKRYGAARRASEASLTLAESHNQHRIRALGLVTRGELLDRRKHGGEAIRCWREASNIAKTLRDRDLQFKAELPLLRVAIRSQDDAVARSIRRRLSRLGPWLPKWSDEHVEFRALIRTMDA